MKKTDTGEMDAGDWPELSGTRLKLLFGMQGMLASLGLRPQPESVFRVPVAKRMAMRPPAWATYPLSPSIRTRIETIPTRNGSIPAKLFVPAEVDRSATCILYMHGGGFVAGGCHSSDYVCASVAEGARTTVVSVEYRLAPEFPFPAGFEDCVDALRWIAEQHSRLGSDRSDVNVMGDSAGGNLAAALCLSARDDQSPSIGKQVLIYPPSSSACSPAQWSSNGLA